MIYTDEDVKKWYAEYLKVGSVFAVAKTFNVSSSSIWRHLKRLEIENGFNNLRRCRYIFNESFFLC
ncbi:MAG: LysR family transcriptional regulator [Patescibacteria group bacterium]